MSGSARDVAPDSLPTQEQSHTPHRTVGHDLQREGERERREGEREVEGSRKRDRKRGREGWRNDDGCLVAVFTFSGITTSLHIHPLSCLILSYTQFFNCFGKLSLLKMSTKI